MIEGSASSAVFGPMIRMFTWLYDTARNNSKEAREKRKTAYKEHFEPAYLRLETIHKNYLTSFHEFYELCRKFETPPKDLLEKFRKFGMEYTTWREDLRNFSVVAEQMSKSFKKPEQKKAINDFRLSIIDYFKVTFTSGQHWPSWFSAFLAEFEQHIREGRSPWDSPYTAMGVNDPKDTFIAKLRSAYEIELPQRWSAISKAKVNLQVVFGL